MTPDTATKKGKSSVIWWLGWIILTIGSFFVSCYFWTWIIADRFGSVHNAGVSVIWVAAVFGTWMILLLPLIILMYNKVDKAYEDARIRREALALKKSQDEPEKSRAPIRSQFVEESQRLLKKDLRKKLRKVPRAIRGGQLVTAILRDGRKIENVFVAQGRDVLGVYGLKRLSFEIGDIVDIEPTDLDKLPDFTPEHWLRLDGVGSLHD